MTFESQRESQPGRLRVPARAYREVICNTLCLPVPIPATPGRDLEMRYSGQLESRVRIPLAPPVRGFEFGMRPGATGAVSDQPPRTAPKNIRVPLLGRTCGEYPERQQERRERTKNRAV